MDYRPLGSSGLNVSPICLGTMQFGGQTDEAEAARILGSAREAGINFIDTAVSYAMGAGESMVGQLTAAPVSSRPRRARRRSRAGGPGSR